MSPRLYSKHMDLSGIDPGAYAQKPWNGGCALLGPYPHIHKTYPQCHRTAGQVSAAGTTQHCVSNVLHCQYYYQHTSV